MQIYFGYPRDFLTFDVLIEIDLKRLLNRIPRLHVRAIAFIAHGDVPEETPIEVQVSVDVLEIDAGGGSQTVATIRALKRRTGGATSPAPRAPRGQLPGQSSNNS